MFCHRTKGAAGCGGHIAFAQQIQSELSPSTPSTFTACYIDQDVECSVRCVYIATELFQQAHCEITAPVVDQAHFCDACLRPSQSCCGGTLYDSTDIRVAGIEYVGNCLEKLGSCHKVTYTPTGHRIGFGKGIDADNAPQIKLVMRKQRAGTDMYTLEKNFIIALI